MSKTRRDRRRTSPEQYHGGAAKLHDQDPCRHCGEQLWHHPRCTECGRFIWCEAGKDLAHFTCPEQTP